MSDVRKNCDSCSNVIVRDSFSQPPPVHGFAIPTENEGEYESYNFVLCTECRSRIIEWVMDEDESPPRVDATHLESAVKEFRRQAKMFEAMADELDELTIEEVDDE